MSDIDISAGRQMLEAARIIARAHTAGGVPSTSVLLSMVAAARLLEEEYSELLLRVATETVRQGIKREPAELLHDALEEATDQVRAAVRR